MSIKKNHSGHRSRRLLLWLLPITISFFVSRTIYADCQLGSAVEFYTEVSVAGFDAMLGMQNPDLLELTMENAYSKMSQPCQEKFQAARRTINSSCANQLNQAQLMIAGRANAAAERYGQTGDRNTFIADTRESMRTFLTSVPRDCWFGNIAAGGAGGGGAGAGNNCQALESNYRSCKQQVEQALKRCAVTPGPCRDRGPYCVLPSSVNANCAP